MQIEPGSALGTAIVVVANVALIAGWRAYSPAAKQAIKRHWNNWRGNRG